MTLISNDIRKSMIIRSSGRSSDFITPSFGYGCLYNCSYCYMKRHKPDGLSVAKNVGDILTVINDHATFLPLKEPNQTHAKYWTYDISCNEDFALHAYKYHNWKYIFDFFRTHDKAFGTFATKYVPEYMLNYNPNNKIRIRFSLIPEVLRKILEPNTSTIHERLGIINTFIENGYDVHLNFSPVIIYKTWLEDYAQLFKDCNSLIKNEYKNKVLAEVIFLTHNENKHNENVKNLLKGEGLLWQPAIQENKTSQYGGKNIRYKYNYKKQYIDQFISLHDSIIKWNKIRYIF